MGVDDAGEILLWQSFWEDAFLANSRQRCVRAKSLQSCLTFCSPVDCSLPVSPVHGILQARLLEGVAMPSSRGSSQPRDRTCISYVSCIGRWVLNHKHHLGSPMIKMGLFNILWVLLRDGQSGVATSGDRGEAQVLQAGGRASNQAHGKALRWSGREDRSGWGLRPRLLWDFWGKEKAGPGKQVQFSSVRLLSCIRLFATPWTAACQASLSIINSQSLPKPMSLESVMPSNHLILCRPLLLLPSIFPRPGSFQMSSSSHQVAKVLEFQLQHQSFQWLFRTDLL